MLSLTSQWVAEAPELPANWNPESSQVLKKMRTTSKPHLKEYMELVEKERIIKKINYGFIFN